IAPGRCRLEPGDRLKIDLRLLKLFLLEKELTTIAIGSDIVLIETNDFVVCRNRLGELAHGVQCDAQVLIRIRKVFLQANRFPVLYDGLIWKPLAIKSNAEVVDGTGVIIL